MGVSVETCVKVGRLRAVIEKEDHVEDVESREPAVDACWILSKGIPSWWYHYNPGEGILQVDQVGVNEQA